MEAIESRFNRIMNKYLLPAGYEFQRVQHDYERLQQGKELFDHDLLARLEIATDNNERHEILTSLKQDVLPNYDDIDAIYSDVLAAIVAAADSSRDASQANHHSIRQTRRKDRGRRDHVGRGDNRRVPLHRHHW